MAYNQYGTDPDGSYQNDPTNVERLCNYYKNEDPHFRIYIEGAGTSSFENEKKTIIYGKNDVLNGTGLGKGENGIRARVLKACKKAAEIAAKKKKVLFTSPLMCSVSAVELLRHATLCLKLAGPVVYEN